MPNGYSKPTNIISELTATEKSNSFVFPYVLDSYGLCVSSLRSLNTFQPWSQHWNTPSRNGSGDVGHGQRVLNSHPGPIFSPTSVPRGRISTKLHWRKGSGKGCLQSTHCVYTDLNRHSRGRPVAQSVKLGLLTSAQVMISGQAWDQAPHWTPRWVWSLLGVLSSLFLTSYTLSNKNKQTVISNIY